MATLKKIVLRATDLPRGWKASPPEPDSKDNSDEELLKCVGAKNTDADEVATTDSDDFALGDVTIYSSATSYKSQSSVDSDVAMLKSPKLVPCFTKMLKKELATALPKGSSLGAVAVKFTPGPGAGPANVAGSGTGSVSVTVGQAHLKMYISFVYVTGPLMEVELDADSLGAPVPAAFQAAVKAVADRAAASGS